MKGKLTMQPKTCTSEKQILIDSPNQNCLIMTLKSKLI